jgi:hypothetical protein
MAEQLRFDFGGKQQRPQPRLLKEPVKVEGLTPLSHRPLAEINKFDWFVRELERWRGLTAGETTEAGLSFQKVAFEFLREPARRGYTDWAERFVPITDNFKRGQVTRRDFARLLTFKDILCPKDDAMAEYLRYPESVTRHFLGYWNTLKTLYNNEEWPGSD